MHCVVILFFKKEKREVFCQKWGKFDLVYLSGVKRRNGGSPVTRREGGKKRVLLLQLSTRGNRRQGMERGSAIFGRKKNTLMEGEKGGDTRAHSPFFTSSPEKEKVTGQEKRKMGGKAVVVPITHGRGGNAITRVKRRRKHTFLLL